MHQTVEAMIDPNGMVHFDKPVKFSQPQRVLVVILEQETPPEDDLGDITFMSEPALARDWNRPEEDQAWAHLQDFIKDQ